MPRYQYLVKDPQGQTLKGLVEAATLRQAVSLLHQQNYYIISLKEESGGFFSLKIGKGGMGFNELVHFTRQLSTMITAGLTLVESLSLIEQQLKKLGVVKIVRQIEEDVRGGKSFTQALERYPKIFPPIYLALVKAGEASGKLDSILGRLADNLEKSRDFRGKLRGAMIYPTIVVTGMVVVSIIVITVVIPRLTSLYQEFSVELPLPTKILISLSSFFLRKWWLLVGGILSLLFAFFKFKSTNFGKHFLASFSLSLPAVGNLLKEATLVEMTRTLAILVEGGVPILTALEISQNATGNIIYQEAFAEIRKRVEKGIKLSELLREDKLFPPIFGQMVAVGEQTGKLGDSLFKLSHFFEVEAENAIHALTTLIEPLIMVLLGVGVAFLVMAILLPIYSLTSKF